MRIFLLLAMLLVGLLTASCKSTVNIVSADMLDSSALIGKSKEEVIDITLRASPKNKSGETQVICKEKNGAYSCYYFTSSQLTPGEMKLLDSSDIWFMDFHPKMVWFGSKDDCIMLQYMNGIVIEAKHMIWKRK